MFVKGDTNMTVDQKVEAFFSQHKPITFRKKALILRAEEEPHGVYYLKSGYVRMYLISEDGKEVTLNIFKPGSFFSMIWALAGKENAYFFEAVTPVVTHRVNREALIEFLDKEPEVERDLLRRILSGLDGILIRMEYFLAGEASQKVAAVITMLAMRLGEKKKSGELVVAMPMTHQEVANLAGMARETASIELKKLKDKGLIEYAHKVLVVKDLNKVREESFIYYEDEPLPYTF